MSQREQLVDSICALVERETRRVAHEALLSLVSPSRALVPRVWGTVSRTVREACRDWAKVAAVRAQLPTASPAHIQGTLARLYQKGQLERRGKHGSYEYRYVAANRMPEAAE